MRIEMEPLELVVMALLTIFVLYITYMWRNMVIGRQSTGQRDGHQHGDTTDGDSDPNDHPYIKAVNDHPYIKAALYALQRHTGAIINISAVQVSPELYSHCLISAETLSMVCSNVIINKYKMLTVFDDLKSKVAVSSSGFLKFIDILRSYPEYEELANDLQGTYHDRCTTMKLIPRAEMPPCDAKDETKPIVFSDKTLTDPEHIKLEAKLDVPPNHGYHSLSEELQRFTHLFNINQSSVSCMVMGKNCVTVSFQVPTVTLPILEKKINDSVKSLPDMKVSLVKILGKTVFETDSDQKTLSKKSKWLPCAMMELMLELEGIGPNSVDCQHHGILQTKTSRCTVVLHEGMIYVGGGTSGRSKESLCNVLVYNSQKPHSVLSIPTRGMKFFSLAVLNNKLTIVGGLDNKVPTNKLYSWDEEMREWSECCPPMPTARRSTTSVTYESYLIVIGGALADTVTLVEVLDIPNQTWYTGPSLPENMYNVHAVVVGNSLYLLGGNSTSVWHCSLPTLIMGAINAVYSLLQLWRKLSSLPYRCSAAALLGKHLLAIGGHDEEATNMTDLIHSYCPEKNCWERAGSLKTGRRNCAAVNMLDQTVFVIGGAESPAYDNYCRNVEAVHLHTPNIT